MRLLTFILILLFASGCSTFYRQRFPVIPIPETPVLQDIQAEEISCLPLDVRAKLIDNYDALIALVKGYQLSVEHYNEMANRLNKESFGGK